MVKIICPNKECRKIIIESENLEKLKNKLIELWIQCPYCGNQFKNPFILQ